MDLMELGAIGELVGGAAVLVTLVYLAIQARYTVASGRIQASSAVTEAFTQAIAFIGQPASNARGSRLAPSRFRVAI